MKKSLLLFLFLSALLPTAFAKHKKTQKKEILSVSMHRTACFGHCPDYLVVVNKNGMVTYTGYMFAKDSGTFKKNVGVKETKKIIDMCATYRLDTCQDVYKNIISDLPGIYYIVQYNNNAVKKITNAHFGPGFLKEIAHSIDGIAQVDSTWVRVPEQAVHKK